MLGNAHLYGLQLHQDSWELPQRLGCIAGTLRFGFRPILLGGSGMCDGTVTVAETQISGMTDHLLLHQSHTGLVYSHQTAQQIDYFIRHNQFQHKKSPNEVISLYSGSQVNNALGKRTTLNAWIEGESGWSQRFCDRQSITHSGI